MPYGADLVAARVLNRQPSATESDLECADPAVAAIARAHPFPTAFETLLLVAEVHAARGETDAAFEWLDRAYTQQDAGLSEAKGTLHLRSLHGGPRWRVLLTKLGFED